MKSGCVNLVEDIINLSRKIKCNKFYFSKRLANVLTDRLTNKAHGNLCNMLYYSVFLIIVFALLKK